MIYDQVDFSIGGYCSLASEKWLLSALLRRLIKPRARVGYTEGRYPSWIFVSVWIPRSRAEITAFFQRVENYIFIGPNADISDR
jgi:hypothetical protein